MTRLAGRFALALCLLFPALSHAAALCPWINATTAFGALGSSPEASGAKSVISATSCTFIYQTATTLRELRVAVDLPPDAVRVFATRKSTCALNQKPLRAIGNEAIMCSLSTNSGAGEQVIGRVRDQIFTLAITEKLSDPAARNPDLPKETEMLAELVAGNLF